MVCKRALAVVVVTAAACRPLPQARLTTVEVPTLAELDAAERVKMRRCSHRLSLLFPGLGQLCLRRDGEAALLAAVAVGELGTAVAVADAEAIDHPGAAVPLLALQDLWAYGVADAYIDRQRAEHALFAPADRMSDLALAPFNGEVLRRPSVWLGTLVILGAGIGVSMLAGGSDVEGDGSGTEVGDDANLFGSRLSPGVGYPLAGLTMGALFSHVAIAEETVFRGALQSGLARSRGETAGWVGASLLFGAVHALNAFALPEEDRRNYLLYGVPFITAIGGYIGHVYRRNGYSLATSTAVHFWYDFLLSATFFVLHPDDSILSASIRLPFPFDAP